VERSIKGDSDAPYFAIANASRFAQNDMKPLSATRYQNSLCLRIFPSVRQSQPKFIEVYLLIRFQLMQIWKQLLAQQ
jgi:hypothetical protein